VSKRSAKEERPSKRHHSKSEISREDTGNNGSMIKENKVRSFWMVRYEITSEEDVAQSSSVNVVEDSDEALQKGVETMKIMRRIGQLEIGSSFGSIIKEEERVWRNPLFKPPPLHICHQEERTKKTAEVREVAKERLEEREVEDTMK
jgi:hypothetical protein